MHVDLKLSLLYEFLKEFRQYNRELHFNEYRSLVLPYNRSIKKCYALLFKYLNTQSQVKLDKTHQFFSDLSKTRLNSFSKFLRFLDCQRPMDSSFSSLQELLSAQPGWGEKTAALFAKAIYNTHHGFAKSLSFWNDVPTGTPTFKEFSLPVDVVIEFIFKNMRVPCTNDFSGINKYLRLRFPESNPIIWDELWFWGYITQRNSRNGTQNERKAVSFNEGKYWGHEHCPKSPSHLQEIKALAKDFYKFVYRRR